MKLGLYLFIGVLFLISCSKDESKNSDAKIENVILLNSNIEGLELTEVVIDDSSNMVYLIPNMPIPEAISEIRLEVDMQISNKSTLTPDSSSVMEFESADDFLLYKITAENGNVSVWKVRFVGNQLPNSHFEYWHEAIGLNDKTYNEPGVDETTIWTTANFGTSLYDVYGTTKFPEGESTQVKLVTGKTDVVPLTAATIYTGTFSVNGVINNPVNPKLATLMGTRFGLRPFSMKIWYRYNPGDTLIQCTPNVPDSIFAGFSVEKLMGKDEFTIYAVLEKRVADKIVEIGRAEFESGDRILRMREIEVPFEYKATDTPTHIYFVASSSKDGDEFKGAVGSTLIIDNLSFTYE